MSHPYDRLAGSYECLERFLLGRRLERARQSQLAWLVDGPVLLLGDGDGRFLAALLERDSGRTIVSLDVSEAMQRRARTRLEARGQAIESVQWLCLDACHEPWPTGPFANVVSQCFFDNFRAETQRGLLASLKAALAPGGRWLYLDFCVEGPGRPGRGLLVAFLYRFFRWRAGIEASALSDPHEAALKLGLRLREEQRRAGGLLVSRCYGGDA